MAAHRASGRRPLRRERLQEHSGPQRDPGGRFHGHHGHHVGRAGLGLLGVSHGSRHRYRQVGSRHGQEAHRPPDDADGRGHQPQQLRRTSGRHLLDVSSRARYSGHDADDRHGVWRAAAGCRRDRQAVGSRLAVCRSDSRPIPAGAWRRRAADERHQFCRDRHERRVSVDSAAAARSRSLRRRRISARRSSSSTQASAARMPSASSTAAADGCRRR